MRDRAPAPRRGRRLGRAGSGGGRARKIFPHRRLHVRLRAPLPVRSGRSTPARGHPVARPRPAPHPSGEREDALPRPLLHVSVRPQGPAASDGTAPDARDPVGASPAQRVSPVQRREGARQRRGVGDPRSRQTCLRLHLARRLHQQALRSAGHANLAGLGHPEAQVPLALAGSEHPPPGDERPAGGATGQAERDPLSFGWRDRCDCQRDRGHLCGPRRGTAVRRRDLRRRATRRANAGPLPERRRRGDSRGGIRRVDASGRQVRRDAVTRAREAGPRGGALPAASNAPPRAPLSRQGARRWTTPRFTSPSRSSRSAGSPSSST